MKQFKFNLTNLFQVLAAVSAYCATLPPAKQYVMEVKEHRERRSLDANAYFWVLCDRLAEHTGIPKAEIYREAIRNIGGNNQIVCVPTKAVDKLVEGWQHNGLGWLRHHREQTRGLHQCYFYIMARPHTTVSRWHGL